MTQPMSNPAPRVVVMNDTSGRLHHGCTRVMRMLVAGLEAQGLQISARSPARHDWAKDPDFLLHLGRADLIVINGEGTLHHGRPAGRALLEVTSHPARGQTPVALVNALYQDNPAGWSEYLADCALISARDPESARAIAAACPGAPLRQVPDLSLADGAAPQPGPRNGLVVGDAVRIGTRRRLTLAAARLGAKEVLPTKTRRGQHRFHPGIGAALRWLAGAGYNAVFPFGTPPLTLARDEADYLARLGQAQMHLTGRFHAVCLSLVTGTPFLAVTSNSWKIEALLSDAGLGPDRILPLDRLSTVTEADLLRPFTEAETASITAFLQRAETTAAELFADLANLARQSRQ